jgi:DNA-binding SARP family transcriptional activator
VEYRVLGKLEVFRDGQAVDLGAFRQRALLALLLTAPNSVFSTDQILDELWGDAGGLDKQNALWVYVSGLRKALEPDRKKRADGTVLLTRPPGYVIQAEVEQIDSVRFEQMVGEGRALSEVDPAAASVVLGEALALWRGRAFEEFTYESFAQAEIARLEGLRLEAVELRLDADLQRGLSRELISELESLVRQYPLREHMTAQLMLALYRSSRQADALRAYQVLNSRLGEELGIEASPRLRTLRDQIVTGDDALEIRSREPIRGRSKAPSPAVRGYEMREQIRESAFGAHYRAYQPAVGREVAITVVGPDVANDPTFIRRFQAEADAIATLEHPHIVPLYDYWREPDAAYLVMPLMPGGSLGSVLDHRALTPVETMTMVEQLGNAIETAHRAGVMHGDINSDNVLLDDDGNAFLSDFGIVTGAGEIDPRSDISGLGMIVAQALTRRSLGVTELREALPDPIARVIDRATALDAVDRYGSVVELVDGLHEVLDGGSGARETLETAKPVDNPYKGLRSFGVVDASDFFGRERLVERLIARLGPNGTRGRFIAVVGPSGSGKSSAVKAGLLPAIRQGAVPESASWFPIEMTPASNPFEQLEDALLGVAVDPPPSLLEQLAGAEGLQRAVDRVLPEAGSQLLLVIDQFEELYTQVEPATANRFLDNLVSAVTSQHSRIRVIVTLRADFYDRPLQQRDLGELLRNGTEIVTPMTAHELEHAITCPAEPYGVSFDPAVVAALVREVTDRPGALPLLQYTLTELFEHRRGDRIDYATYEELGGVSGTLVKRAEGLLASLGDDTNEVARQVFLRLVAFNESGEDTRRRVLQSELEDLGADRLALRSVLTTFGRHRLLSFDRDPVTRSPTVEISHEALLTEWTRLQNWIDGARDDVRIQRRLAEAMHEWLAADRDDAYLLKGGVLEQSHGWVATTSVRLSAPERSFLEASVAERDREAQDVREREQRAVEAERRQQQRGRQLLVVGLVTVLVAALAMFGTVQWRSALGAKGDLEDRLTVDDLVGASRAALIDDPQLALLLAMQSVRETVELGFATEEAVDAVHFALQELGVQYDVAAGTPVAVRSGPHGLVGVYALSPNELMETAESGLQRTLTEEECATFLSGACPAPIEVPDDLPLRRGMDVYGASAPGPAALAGTTVRLSAGVLTDDPSFAIQLADFTERTGITVEFMPDQAEPPLNSTPAEPNRRPDVVQAPFIPAWASDRALDVSRFIDPGVLRSDFGALLLSAETTAGVDGALPLDAPVSAIPLTLGMKGLVFYPEAEFVEAGYEVPTTWTELDALSHRIAADGRTPWCFGFESGYANGWPGSDFVESLVLRVGGVEVYDAWTIGDVGFTSPEVIEAGRIADDLIFEPGFRPRRPGRDQPAEFQRADLSPGRGRRDRRGRTRVLALPREHGYLAVRATGGRDRRPRFRHRFLPAPSDRSRSGDTGDRRPDLRHCGGRHARGACLPGVRRQSGVG